MKRQELLELLNSVKNGTIEPNTALEKIKLTPYDDLGFANVDTSRSLRQGVAEVIYGEGKSKEQIKAIVESLLANGEKTILVTRIDKEKVDFLSPDIAYEYDEIARVCIIGERAPITGKGKIVVCCAGTSDLYCAKEAVLTAVAFGNEVECLFDVGVAGIHRLLDKIDIFANARVVIAVAGMEGALASVVGGLADCPVIAVPTSVGYGANFGGVSALLAMLNSCASNVSVVNIDNGFGAGYIASIINHLE
jgi:hypothetical protein